MIKKEAQITLQAKIEADTVIQLKDGRLLFYYFREAYDIYVYNEKTFEKLFEINLDNLKYEIINKFEGNKEKNNNQLKNNIEGEEDDYTLLFNARRNKNSIKELDNGLVLIGRDKYLIELNLHKKNYDYNLAKLLDDDILEINQLSDKRIMVCTTKKIILFERKNEEYIFKEEYQHSCFWKLSEEVFSSNINLYFFSYELPNNRLLLNSLLIQNRHSGCLFGGMIEYSKSKIIFIDLKNFKIILSTEGFNGGAENIILENEIVIQSFEGLTIYDINSLEPIKVINCKKGLGFLYKFDKNHLIASSVRDEKNNLVIYKIENKDLVKQYVIRANLFKRIFPQKKKRMIGGCEFIFLLRDKRIMISYYEKIYLFEMIKE